MTESSTEVGGNISFEEVLSRAQVERILDPSITQTAKALLSASLLEQGRDILLEARERLLKEDPRKLFLECVKFIVTKIKSVDKSQRYYWLDQLDSLAIRGLGIKIDDLEFIGDTSLNIFRAEPKWDNIKKHIDSVVLGKYFIEEVSVPSDDELWKNEFPLRMSSCDASQHRFKLRIPFLASYFSTPIIVNNAAGVIKERKTDKPGWVNIVVPKNTQGFEDWVVIGYDDYSNLTSEDYEWAAKSAMDVGQYFVEETYVLSYKGAASKPDIHLRDGRVFPQDKAMNCRLQNRHGQLTREALWRMCTTLKKARDLDIIFCGVSKNVELKVFSTLVDWYIREEMKEEQWNTTRHILTDSEVMKNMIYHKEFNSTFSKIFITCKVVRSFYTTSNFNNRTDKQFQNDLESLKDTYHNRDLTAKKIVEEALKYKVAMFFAGHSNTNEYYIPRYEFVLYEEDYAKVDKISLKILSALRLGTFQVDTDHLRNLEEPLLIPIPLTYSHDLSKAMGEILSHDWMARTYAEFMRLKKQNNH